MSTAHTTFETQGPLAILTFNRPDARNAMTWDMYQALTDACERAGSETRRARGRDRRRESASGSAREGRPGGADRAWAESGRSD